MAGSLGFRQERASFVGATILPSGKKGETSIQTSCWSQARFLPFSPTSTFSSG